MEEFPVEIMQKVFVSDSKLSSHPIVHDVKNADDISSFFDGISYKKVYDYKILFNNGFALVTNFLLSRFYLLELLSILGSVYNPHDGELLWT